MWRRVCAPLTLSPPQRKGDTAATPGLAPDDDDDDDAIVAVPTTATTYYYYYYYY